MNFRYFYFFCTTDWLNAVMGGFNFTLHIQNFNFYIQNCLLQAFNEKRNKRKETKIFYIFSLFFLSALRFNPICPQEPVFFCIMFEALMVLSPNFFLFLQYFMLYLYTGRHYNCISMLNINKDNNK